MIARVAVDAGVDRLFDYAVPEALRTRAVPGCRVRVPFGKRTAQGYVVEVADDPTDRSDPTDPADLRLEAAPAHALKHILSVEGGHPFLTEPLLRLLRWIADYYGAPLELAIRTALPAPVRSARARPRERLFVSVKAESDKSDKSDSSDPCDSALSPRQAALLADIRRLGGGWLPALCRELHCTPETLRRLEKAGRLAIEAREVRRDPLAHRTILPTAPLELMPEQAAALAEAAARCDAADPRPLLLLGVTGSGKTEVYLQAIARVLAQDRGAIVLVPEIALTPQTVQRFAGRFGGRVAVLHSALSDGERHDEWHRIRRGEARVVVGPRSAVFAPVARLGLIVVDEEHEPSYKQDEAPRYHARDVAVMRGRIERCAVLLGSATPAMESWHNARRGKYGLARLTKRVDDRPMPSVRIVDMRAETVRTGHVQVFSAALLGAVQARLGQGEQTMLFLNRRGYATSLVCTRCGFVATCAACAVAFTYHQADLCLRCHTCGAWQAVPAACPGCADPAFRYAGFGTQRVETILHKCFPQARVARMDADVTARRHSHDEILGAFRAGRTDILVGTQMIAKGLHFPNVTLVGVLVADMSLHLPDFRAGERTFQLLAQVSGRAGRGEVPGEVIVQTYTPGHPAVIAAETADFERFAAAELADRRSGGFPPFTHLACATFRGASDEKAAFVARAFADALRQRPDSGLVIGAAAPAPRPMAKGEFRHQVLVRAAAGTTLAAALRQVARSLRPPPDVSLAVDMDAVNVL
jgi:primosomal protein N' (replication factor Y)